MQFLKGLSLQTLGLKIPWKDTLIYAICPIYGEYIQHILYRVVYVPFDVDRLGLS